MAQLKKNGFITENNNLSCTEKYIIYEYIITKGIEISS
jgi:hypothetical protein